MLNLRMQMHHSHCLFILFSRSHRIILFLSTFSFTWVSCSHFGVFFQLRFETVSALFLQTWFSPSLCALSITLPDCFTGLNLVLLWQLRLLRCFFLVRLIKRDKYWYSLGDTVLSSVYCAFLSEVLLYLFGPLTPHSDPIFGRKPQVH